MAEINYKAKYMELRAKFMDAVDTAFRLGYQQGGMEAQMQAQQQQAEQQAQMEAEQAAAQGQPGEEGAPVEGQEQAPQDSAHPGGSELDQHIAKLESMISKSDVDVNDLKKTIDDLKQLQKSYKEQLEIKKSAAAIPGIVKALHKPAFKIGQQASHNMDSNAKTAVSMQQKIVTDIFKKWEQEESKAVKSIAELINVQGITDKKE